MARVVLPLSDARVKSAKVKDKKYKLYDGNNLALVVYPSGKKSWVVKYKIFGKFREMIIGEYPFISLKEARAKAYSIKEQVLNGIDPLAEKRNIINRVKSVNFGVVVKEFMEFKEAELAYSHIKKQQSRLDNYILPFLGNKPIKEIKKGDIVAIVKGVKSVVTKTSRKGNKEETAKRVFMLLNQIFRFALHNDYIEVNVADSIDLHSIIPKREKVHIKAVVELEDVKTIFKIIKEYPGVVTGLALEFLALTALRSGNVRELRWTWVDLKSRVITIPGSNMKNREEFRVPITNRVLEILKEMESITRDSEYVFCSTLSKSKKLSENTLNMAHKRLGVDNHSAHGWRSAFSTICYKYQKEHGFSSEVIESQLAHAIGNSVTRAYMRGDFLEERAELLEWWFGVLE